MDHSPNNVPLVRREAVTRHLGVYEPKALPFDLFSGDHQPGAVIIGGRGRMHHLDFLASVI
jgi:hypothetical protein